VAGATDTEQLDVNATGGRDFGFVLEAPLGNIFRGNRAVGNVYVFAGNVDEIEQVFAHEPHVALQTIRLHRKIFVQIERDHVGQRKSFFAVQADQFGVDIDGRGSGRQAEDASFAFGGALPD
jgi:hypothetical protein